MEHKDSSHSFSCPQKLAKAQNSVHFVQRRGGAYIRSPAENANFEGCRKLLLQNRGYSFKRCQRTLLELKGVWTAIPKSTIRDGRACPCSIYWYEPVAKETQTINKILGHLYLQTRPTWRNIFKCTNGSNSKKTRRIPGKLRFIALDEDIDNFVLVCRQTWQRDDWAVCRTRTERLAFPNFQLACAMKRAARSD